MTQFYILVEGINIYANVFDTKQLSVIRGSSFLFKKAIDHLTEHAAIKDKFIALSTGASSGLYLVNNGESVTEIVLEIETEFHTVLTRLIVF